MTSIDIEILKISIKKLSEAFDEFISECSKDPGKSKDPGNRALAQARACLPPYCKNSFKKVINKSETTKKCPQCGNEKLILIRTQNHKFCSDCDTKIDWNLEKDQKPLL